MSGDLVSLIKQLLRDVTLFIEHGSGLKLRAYQREVARTIVRSVLKKQGLTIVVMFPRQSGKNELQAQVETYLLRLFSERDAEIVKVSPTWKPQSLNAMRRLQRVLERNVVTRGLWSKEQGYIYRIDRARIFFLSGSPEANIVGATASTLLEVDEAQDVLPSKYDKEIAPMAASANATQVFWGTAWTGSTLLARELRAARKLEEEDGQRRVFVVDARAVAAEVPDYGRFVDEQIAHLGRDHPMVKTQFFCEEIDADGGMFPPARRALMVGDHAACLVPLPGRIYCLLLDVAGEDEGARSGAVRPAGQAAEGLANPGRDATALTIVEVDLSSAADALVHAPVYRVVYRQQWLGVRHTLLYSQLTALAEAWRARFLVVDATGVGAGLASFLDRALPGKVKPFIFNSASKSKLGWDFLSLVETGRFKDYRRPSDDTHLEKDQEAFWRQVEACQMAVQPGPEQRLKWSVPDGTRDPRTGEPLHDDLLLSAALAAVLDGEDWALPGATRITRGRDPLRSIDAEGY